MREHVWRYLPLLGLFVGGCAATKDAPTIAGAVEDPWVNGPRVPL